jgi:hypothetical protein
VTDRATFIRRLRAAVPTTDTSPRGEPPAVAWADPGGGVDRWRDAFEALGGHVHDAGAHADSQHAAGDGEGPAVAGAGHGPAGAADDRLAGIVARVARGRGPILRGRDARLAAVGADLVWPACGVTGAATAGVAVVGATAGIATTGSIVLDATSQLGRSVSLLAPVCIFVLDPADIVDTAGGVLRDRGRWWPAGPPSQILLVTGPSRSADIEMTLAVGIHGPGEVHAILL